MDKVVIFIGLLFILWGILVLYSSFFKMKKGEYRDKDPIGVSGYVEFEFLFKLLSRLPYGVVKGFTLFIGVLFVTLGTFIIT